MDSSRDYNPPLKATDTAREACRSLGAELLRAGCDLAVFSSKNTYIEADVVQGYAAAGTAESPGTVFAYPPRHRTVDFALPPDSAVTMQTVRDTSGEWEVSYYRTLLNSDGVLMVGGGQSTRVAGIVALSQGVPVLPVAAFGGGASQVWVNLDKTRNGAGDADIALMGDDWQPDAASRLVACLLRQRTQRLSAEAEARRAGRFGALRASASLALSVLCMLLAIAAIVFAPGAGPASAKSLTMLLLAPLVAATAGALIRHSFETGSSPLRAAVRGLGAGLVSVLLYCASQLLTVPALLDTLDVRRLLFFTIPLGFSAGFTFDLVFERLRAGAGPVAPPGVDPLATTPAVAPVAAQSGPPQVGAAPQR
ncbi:hypothetical protein GCM10017674_78400 [Streptomyces gardneri]|uniref:Uncharacterized protein n=1 Tax=Streptomyces gardneri TaxID=66892 RepID=A0A4Y3RMY3_9ACTN|nr:hypothetical protein SGA01_27850 [Streptomyces gardneri]GHH22546.1 hypothetical protein GCM10017674_78400 [Streptomyces gardneri]